MIKTSRAMLRLSRATRRFGFRLASLLVGCGVIIGSGTWLAAQNPVPSPQSAAPIPTEETRDEDAVDPAQAVFDTYVTAFNQHDVEALLKLWVPEGVFAGSDGGGELVGEAALREAYTQRFSEGNPQLAIEVGAVRELSPSVVLATGEAVVTIGDEVVTTDFSTVLVRHDGQWRIDRVTEEERIEPPSHFEHLQSLEWMIGTWESESDSLSVATECRWAKNQNFIVRSFILEGADRTISGMQLIGWDAANQRIRSWAFDSDGGFAEGMWTQQGTTWHVTNQATTPDGARGASTSVFEPLGDNQFSWQVINRSLDGELLPNLEPIVVARRGLEDASGDADEN